MLFNSYSFIFVFLPIVFLVFFRVGKYNRDMAAAFLGTASFFFYGWWNSKYVIILSISIILNYGAGYAINALLKDRPRLSKKLLIIGICFNLLLLSYYKYTNFFLGSLSQISGMDLTVGRIILPLGISFFTFTQIGFLVDVYAEKVREYNFLHYLLFVTYFPHLIAGPVLHHAQIIPQFILKKTYRFNMSNICVGLTFFSIGLAKKVFLADNFAVYVTPVFDASSAGIVPTMLEAWGGALAYTLQLYFDFSGYSDMAIGISQLFNVRLPVNFNSPYKAINIIEFWRCWHISLAVFLRDYLYIPLGGNRKGQIRRYLNLMITMFLGGLWHGAGWTFIVWGCLHGLYLSINHGFRSFMTRIGIARKITKFGTLTSSSITFVSVVVAWVIFRSDTLSSAFHIISGMIGIGGISLPQSLEYLFLNNHLKFLTQGLGFVFEGGAPVTKMDISSCAS